MTRYRVRHKYLPEAPCPICTRPFRARYSRNGAYTITCSRVCSAARLAQRHPSKVPIRDDLGNKYESVTAAAVVLGIAQPSITMVLKGRRARAGGRSFSYVQEAGASRRMTADEIETYRQKERQRLRKWR